MLTESGRTVTRRQAPRLRNWGALLEVRRDPLGAAPPWRRAVPAGPCGALVLRQPHSLPAAPFRLFGSRRHPRQTGEPETWEGARGLLVPRPESAEREVSRVSRAAGGEPRLTPARRSSPGRPPQVARTPRPGVHVQLPVNTEEPFEERLPGGRRAY